MLDDEVEELCTAEFVRKPPRRCLVEPHEWLFDGHTLTESQRERDLLRLDRVVPVAGVWLEHRSETGDLPGQTRQLLRRSELAAETLLRGLRRAVVQHGPFKGGSGAAEFAEEWLDSAERRERKRRLPVLSPLAS